MVNKWQRADPGPWCKGEYTTGIILRFTLMILLWVLYGLIPHKLPLETLHLFTLVLVAYDIYLFATRNFFMAWTFVVAIILNELLVLYLHPGFNLLLTILITAILILDIINAPTS